MRALRAINGETAPSGWVTEKARWLGREIDRVNPLHRVQDYFDNVYATYLKPHLPKNDTELKCDPAKHNIFDRINLFLDTTTYETKTAKVAFFAATLIPRVLRNLLSLSYHAIKILINFLFHPLEVLAEACVFLSKILIALKNPKFYSSAGAGFIGAAVGQGIVSPQAISCFIIGGSLLVGGLLFGAIKATVTTEKGKRWDAVVDQLGDQIKDLPEIFLTGLLIGLMIGAIQQTQSMDPNNPSAQAIGLSDDVGCVELVI